MTTLNINGKHVTVDADPSKRKLAGGRQWGVAVHDAGDDRSERALMGLAICKPAPRDLPFNLA